MNLFELFSTFGGLLRHRNIMRNDITLLVSFVLILWAPAGSQTSTQAIQKVQSELKRGQSIEKDLSAGEKHIYTIRLDSKEYMHVVVEQHGIDVKVTLLAPNKKQVEEVDSPIGAQGLEHLYHIAKISGIHTIEIRALQDTAAAGRYTLTFDKAEKPTAQDKISMNRINAQRLFAEGEKLSSYRKADSLRKAIEKYKESVSYWESADSLKGLTITLDRIGDVYNILGEKYNALASYNRALPLVEAANDSFGIAALRNDIAAVNHDLGEFNKTLEGYQRAYDIVLALEKKDWESAALNNLAAVYDDLGEREKVLKLYEKSLDIAKSINDVQGQGRTLHNRANYFERLGEMQKALNDYNKALPFRKKVGDKGGEARSINGLANVYAKLGDYVKAIQYLNEALVIRKEIGDKRGIGITTNNLGYVYYKVDSTEKALQLYNEALEIHRKIPNQPGEATALHNIGFYYYRMGDYQNALHNYNLAFSIRKKINAPEEQATTLAGIGLVYHSMDEFQKAIEYFNEALVLSRKVLDRKIEAETLVGLAKVERALGNLDKAKERIEAALNIFDSLRGETFSPELRASYFASVQPHYEFYIDLLMQMHELYPTKSYHASALHANERALARSLLEMLAEGFVNIRTGVDSVLLDQEYKLKKLIETKKGRLVPLLLSKGMENQAEKIKNEIDSLQTQYQLIQAEIRAASPQYAALTQPEPLSAKSIQESIVDDETLLLEFALGEKRSVLWAVTPRTIESFELPKRAKIDSVARQVYDLMKMKGKYLDNVKLNSRN